MKRLRRRILAYAMIGIMLFSLMPFLQKENVVNAADYSNGGCVSWVKDRAKAKLGITLPATGNSPSGVYGASNYWTVLPGYGYSKGSEPKANSLAIWACNNTESGGISGHYGHVAYVESVNGDVVEVTEGGCAGYSYNGNTGVIHRTRNKNQMSNLGGCSNFLGYVYLQGTHTHSYTSSITKQPTCTQTGVKTYRCSCGSSYTESVAAKGHSYKNTVVAPTMTEKGYTIHTCSVCGNSYKDKYVDAPVLGSDGWYTCTQLPESVTSDEYTIEYNNYYEKNQASSPGTDWTNAGVVKNEWQNSGSTYTSNTDLATSDSRVLVSSAYYHFCGPSAGNEGNYEQTGKFVHYDSVDANQVSATYCGTDNGHPYYVLDWKNGGGRVWCKSGTTCDGSYGSHGTRCKAWYKLNTYQDRVKVVQYKYTKNSGWVDQKDASATSTTIRFQKVDTATTTTPSSSTGDSTTGESNDQNTTTNTDANLENETNTTDTTKADGTKTDATKSANATNGRNTNRSVSTTSTTSTSSSYSQKVKKVTGLKVTTKGSRKIKAAWNKDANAYSYVIQIATKRNFKKGKMAWYTSGRKCTIKNLKKGKTYYVRVRASGINYGPWSAVKKVKVR